VKKYPAGRKRNLRNPRIVISDFQEYLDGDLIEELPKKISITVNP